MMGTCQLIVFVIEKREKIYLTSSLISDITPFSQFDLVILSMP